MISSRTHNEQVYNDQPVIVPLVTALVYDVTQYNTLNATTFVLPVCYVRDQISPGTFYVSRLRTNATIGGGPVDCGQTAVFPGGPGYDDTIATPLNLKTTSVVVTTFGVTFTTYTFDTATTVTVSTFSPKVRTGVTTLTYSSGVPSSIFAGQRIIGFYRDTTWKTCLGVPIYDFGAANANFSATSRALDAPEPVYDPTNPFLNGGSLQNVVRQLEQASYLNSTDTLLSILNGATAAGMTDAGAGLSVTSAVLNFNLSSTPTGPIVDQLTVPIVASVTTTPPPVTLPKAPPTGLPKSALGGQCGSAIRNGGRKAVDRQHESGANQPRSSHRRRRQHAEPEPAGPGDDPGGAERVGSARST